MKLDPSNTFFVADLHLFHHNALENSGRPHGDVNEMHDWIVERWHSAGIMPDSTVLILGDLTMSKGPSWADRIVNELDRLPGRLHVIPGNHDKANTLNAIANTYAERARLNQGPHDRFVVLNQIEVIKFELDGAPHKAALCHYPMLEHPGKHRGDIHLHGHQHGTGLARYDRTMDVGIDALPGNLPVRLDVVARELLRRPATADQTRLKRLLEDS